MDIETPSFDPLQLNQEDLETLFESTLNEKLAPGSEPSKRDDMKPPLSKASLQASKVDRRKTSLRMKYEAEVQVIKKTHGNLETIRRQLGLSKRKMAQLLLVDPSAWTRWSKTENEAPPHVYRALQWYLLLQEKHPEYKSSLWLNAVATPSLSTHEVENLKKEVLSQVQAQWNRTSAVLEKEPVDLSPLERRLQASQKQVQKLQQRIQWLVLTQVLFWVALLFMAF
jgi:hypothetical protein